MRVVSGWTRWRKCHSNDWVSQHWSDWYAVDGEKPGVDSSDEGKHTGKNPPLFVEKMMWIGERLWPKMKSECCEEAERDEVTQLWRLGGCENFVGKWSLYSIRSVIFNKCRDSRVGVRDLFEPGDLRIGQVVIESCSSSQAWVNDRRGDGGGCLGMEVWTDTGKMTNMAIARFAEKSSRQRHDACKNRRLSLIEFCRCFTALLIVTMNVLYFAILVNYAKCRLC